MESTECFHSFPLPHPGCPHDSKKFMGKVSQLSLFHSTTEKQKSSIKSYTNVSQLAGKMHCTKSYNSGARICCSYLGPAPTDVSGFFCLKLYWVKTERLNSQLKCWSLESSGDQSGNWLYKNQQASYHGKEDDFSIWQKLLDETLILKVNTLIAWTTEFLWTLIYQIPGFPSQKCLENSCKW